jgi:hypothetical protein
VSRGAQGPEGWNRDGIEGEHRFVTLLYNEPADVLIAQFERMVADGRYPVRSLYTKRAHEVRYLKSFDADERSSAFHVVTAAKRPVAFFDVHVASIDRWPSRTPGMGFDWSRIQRIDLAIGTVTTVIDAADFREKHDGRWVADLLGADEDGEGLICRIGMGRKLPGGAATGGVAYSLCRVILATSDIQVIAPLRHVFF